MHMRSLIGAGALLAFALGCGNDAESPSAPAAAAPRAAAAATLTFRQVSAGGDHTCGVTTADIAYCWGVGEQGELGTGTYPGPEICGGLSCSSRPIAVAGGLRFRTVTAGLVHSCGVTTTNRAFCWGSNTWGQIGDGASGRTLRRLAPIQVVGGMAFQRVTAGTGHTCGITSANLAYCWGLNGNGQLGDGTKTDRAVPVAVAGGHRFSQLAAGGSHTCGITTEGKALCWGGNRSGQVGDSTTAVIRRRPTAVASSKTFRQIDAGTVHTCAVATGGRVFCWGDGRLAPLGDGKQSLRNWPAAVRGQFAFASVTTGDSHSCVVTTDHRALCWGYNDEWGQLGNGSTNPSLTPVAVAGGLSLEQVDAAERHTCATTASGGVYCWGWNLYGQLGDGTMTDHLTPAPVVGPT